MRRSLIIVWSAIWALLPQPCHLLPGQRGGGFWKAEQIVYEVGYGSEAHIVQYNYDVFQNDKQVVRRELTHMTRNPIAEIGRDVKIIDYRQGRALAFNKGSTRAERYPVRTVGSLRALENRMILDHQTAGTETTRQDRDGTSYVSQSWVPRDSEYKEPLLKIEYSVGPGGRLGFFVLQVTTRIEKVDSLDPSLFEPPSGLQVNEIGP
jgi:hypothetical protein